MATMLKAVAVCMLVFATFTIAEQPDEIVPEFVEFLHDSGDADVEEIQESSPKTSRAGTLNGIHKMLDNIQDLISYSKAVKDKATQLQGESASVTHSVITNSLIKYASVHPKDMVTEYAKYTGDLKKFFDKGLAEYILSHANKAILHGEGVVSIRKVGISGATKAILNHEALGLRAEPRFFRRLAATVSEYQAAEAAVSAHSGNADNLAAMECLKNGQMKQYKTFLERVKEKYKQQAEDEYAKIVAAADKSEVVAFKKQKKVHVEAPAGMTGAEDEVRKLSQVALHASTKPQPSEREMIEEAKKMAAEWARGNAAACSNTVAVVTKIEQGQKDSPNCDAIAGEYKLGVKLTVKKGAIKGVYKDQSLLDEPLSGGIEKETKTECTGSATGHRISVTGGAATATFKFNKKTKVITWSSGETWTQGKHVKKKPPAPKKTTTFVGCFKDKSKRDLPVHKKNGSKASCAKQCQGYKYYGRQYTEECYCGNSYGKYGKTTGCKCDSKQIGGWKNCVYSETPSKPIAPPAPKPAVKECHLGSIKGFSNYAWDPKGKYCYHVKLGSYVQQDWARSEAKCNQAGFKSNVYIGRFNGDAHDYTNGDSTSCPGGKKRSVTVRVKMDPSAKKTTAVVTEPSTCAYSMVVTRKSCPVNTTPKAPPKPKAPYVLKIAVTTGTKANAQSGQKPSVTIVGTKGKFTGKITVGGSGAKKETTFKPGKDIGSVKSVTFVASSTDGWLIAKTEVKSGALGWQSVGCAPEWLDGTPYDKASSYGSVKYGDKLTLTLTADCKKTQFVPLKGSFSNKGDFAKWATAANAKLLEGDFNGDGKADMAITGPNGWGTIPVAFSNGDGSYRVENKKVSKFPGWAKHSGVMKVTGDFNGDGKTDIAMTGGNGWGTIPVAFSNGDGTFRVTNKKVSHFPGWSRTAHAKLVAGDFNGDGKADIAISGPSGWNTIPVATSDGTGGFAVTNHNPGSDWTKNWAKSARHIVAGDFDGDGKADLALAGGKGWTTIPVATSTGGGKFKVSNHHAPKFPSWAQDKTMMVAGDFNGDKKADLALTGPSGWATIPVAFSKGGGKFSITNDKVASFPGWAAASGTQVVAGDFTGDGKADISVLGHNGWKSAYMAKSTM